MDAANISGILNKMSAKLSERGEVIYQLSFQDKTYFDLNPYIGQQTQIAFQGQIACKHCTRPTKKSFSQGYCYPCCMRLAACDLCIMKPETCHFAAGTCREPEWAEQHCMQAHIVYLAFTSGYKVGITRKTQIPTRWIDQGALAAIPLFEVGARLDSGQIEVALKSHVADKTHWQTMLKTLEFSNIDDFLKMASNLQNAIDSDLLASLTHPEKVIKCPIKIAQLYQLIFPNDQIPPKLKSMSLDKTPNIEGKLLGIKGQYLILDQGVFNIRKHTSYDVAFGFFHLQ